MSYSKPPNYITGTGTSDPVAGVQTSFNIVSGGISSAVRIVGGLITNRASTTLGDRWLFSLSDSVTGDVIWRGSASVGYDNNAYVVIPEPGIQLATNATLVLNVTNSAASKSFGYTIFYYFDITT